MYTFIIYNSFVGLFSQPGQEEPTSQIIEFKDYSDFYQLKKNISGTNAFFLVVPRCFYNTDVEAKKCMRLKVLLRSLLKIHPCRVQQTIINVFVYYIYDAVFQFTLYAIVLHQN